MELKEGSVVKSKAGRDKGRFMVVINFDESHVYVCDGKERPLERPKKKIFVIFNLQIRFLEKKRWQTTAR